MIEEGFVRLYANDFATLAARAESGSDVEPLVRKRIAEARSHAALMDARKGEGHLPAVAERLDQEAVRSSTRVLRESEDVAGAMARRKAFLQRVAEILRAPLIDETSGIALRAVR
ncbi:hypothetical protein GVN21_04955 [Caulobacter sp. SLTY]|uniref:hypothetical protein n=1 Tax=Caulobacter sp. SLTY TaxID=2683262 RepID=UPI00141277F2|nr:hypothetical protein [Caulobacter sp. SLTY]NBB14711.1 hypothetical protein [Caulobacter sp. SLTY]